MDPFEIIISKFLQEKNYWVRSLVKVPFSKTDKRKIKNPTIPTPEIDIIAYNFKQNELLLVECKSLLDSKGIRFNSLIGKNQKFKSKYKLFNSSLYRNRLTKIIRMQYIKSGLINDQTTINYALAAGKIYSKDKVKFDVYFKKRGWLFFSPNEIKDSIVEYSKKSYENDLIVMLTKLILR